MLLILKLLVAPGLVAGVTLAVLQLTLVTTSGFITDVVSAFRRTSGPAKAGHYGYETGSSLVSLFVATVIGRRVLPAVEMPASSVASPRGDLMLRLLATATLVLVLTAVADRLGPRLSGLLNAFPVLTTIITNHEEHERK